LDAENYKAYDVVLVNDREQGLKDFLELSQGNGVAYTTGRELVCTSPFSAESFHESIYLAKDILNARERYDEAHKNPLPKLFVDKKDDIKKH
jgi:4-hydroxythreonine-4-phosphate dehydrogenase